ncbi:hypothetical protein Hanom_Chr01g00051121 [Helianthus anomalus]
MFPERIVIYTLSFSSCGLRYPLLAFKVDFLKHFGIHFSQLDPLAFMRVVHFEFSCVAVAGEPSVPLFCKFYKLVSDGDWFTFAKRKDSISPPFYSFMPTSTYPKEWKNTIIFASAAMIPESPPLRIPMHQLKTAFRSCLQTRSFKMTLWGLPQGDCRDIKFMVSDKVDPDMSLGLEKKAPGTGSSLHVGDSVAEEKDENVSSDEEGDSLGSLRVKDSSDDEDDEDLERRLLRKRKADHASSPKVAPAPQNIRLRLRSASGSKPFPAIKASSEIPPAGTKGSLSRHLRNFKAPIVIPHVPASSRVKDKTPEVSVSRVNPAFDISPLQATISKPSHPEGLVSQSPLAPLFAEGLPVPYVPKWKITTSTVVGTPETAQDFLDHVVPPPHKFMNFALTPDLFDDQYSMSLCEGFFRGAGMLQWVDELRKTNKELRAEQRNSQTIAAELRCRVTDVERKLLEEKNAGALLEQRERAWERERTAWAERRACCGFGTSEGA